MKLIFTRHGETEANAQYIAEGLAPGVLTPKGLAQHKQATKVLASLPLTSIVTSPLHRALHLARSVDSKLYKKDGFSFSKDENLQEGYAGIFEGKPLVSIDWSNPSIESLDSKLLRVKEVLEDHVVFPHAHLACEPALEPIIYFSTHGGMLKALHYYFTGKQYQEKILNASISVVSYVPDKNYKIETFNNVDHLKDAHGKPRTIR